MKVGKVIRKRAVTDTVNPPGQIVNALPQTLEKNIEAWKKWQIERNAIAEHERKRKEKQSPQN